LAVLDLYCTLITVNQTVVYMRLLLMPAIFYENLTEYSDGKAQSRFFCNSSPLRSRELCLTQFLELVCDDDLKPEETFVTVYARHYSTGQRIEILNSSSWENGRLDSFAPLRAEFELYQRENIRVEAAVVNHQYPQLLTLLKPDQYDPKIHKSANTSIFLAQNHWLFKPAFFEKGQQFG